MSWLMSIASDIHVMFDGNVDVAVGELGSMLLGVMVLGVVDLGINDHGYMYHGVLVNELDLEDVGIAVEHGINVLAVSSAGIAVIIVNVVGIVVINVVSIVIDGVVTIIIDDIIDGGVVDGIIVVVNIISVVVVVVGGGGGNGGIIAEQVGIIVVKRVVDEHDRVDADKAGVTVMWRLSGVWLTKATFDCLFNNP